MMKKNKGTAITQPNIKDLEKAFNGDLDLVLFFLSWVKNGQNASKAYLELNPHVDPASARVLGSRQLAKVNINAVLETYGLGVEEYMIQLKEGLTANKQISGVIINGKVQDADTKTANFVEVPDHAVRKGYHDKLGKLLGLESDKGGGVAVQVNFGEYAKKQREEYEK